MILKDRCDICGGVVTATFIYEENSYGHKEKVLNDVRCIECGKAIVYPCLTYEEFVAIEHDNMK